MILGWIFLPVYIKADASVLSYQSDDDGFYLGLYDARVLKEKIWW